MTLRGKYSKEDTDYVIRHYPHEKTSDIAIAINRSMRSVYQLASRLALTKTEQYLSTHDSGRLQKGHTSKGGQWNKGKKMSAEVYAKCSGTMFKKGQFPKNTKYDGYISIRYDKDSGKHYKYIRVDGKFVEYHRLLWKAHNGEIPKGYNLVFRDNNTMHTDITNLELISDAELMDRNTFHKYPKDLKETMRALWTLQRRIKKHKTQEENEQAANTD